MKLSVLHIRALVAMVCVAMGWGIAPAQTPGAVTMPADKITVTVDTAAVTMGERTTVRVELLKNGHSGRFIAPVEARRGQQENAPERMYLGGMEVRQFDADSTDLGNDRVQVNYSYLLQPFEPGDFGIEPFKYVADGDTIKSNVVALKVLEPEMPQEMRDSLWINPMRGTLSIESEWYDWVPDWFSDYWYWWVGGLLLLAAVVAVILLYRKNGKSILPLKKRVPPYVLATRRLEELKRKRLHEQGHAKAYYTELTDILRQYLGGRFRIYALEMTSPQILSAIKANAETAPFAAELKPMFDIADFVKFAKQDATTDQNIRSFNAVDNFVKSTRPAEPEESRPTVVAVKRNTPRRSKSQKKRNKQ